MRAAPSDRSDDRAGVRRYHHQAIGAAGERSRRTAIGVSSCMEGSSQHVAARLPPMQERGGTRSGVRGRLLLVHLESPGSGAAHARCGREPSVRRRAIGSHVAPAYGPKPAAPAATNGPAPAAARRPVDRASHARGRWFETSRAHRRRAEGFDYQALRSGGPPVPSDQTRPRSLTRPATRTVNSRCRRRPRVSGSVEGRLV